jgi:hypothetical protein
MELVSGLTCTLHAEYIVQPLVAPCRRGPVFYGFVLISRRQKKGGETAGVQGCSWLLQGCRQLVVILIHVDIAFYRPPTQMRKTNK